MACFLVPAAEAVIVTAVTKAAESKEKKAAAEESGVFTEEMTPVSFTKKQSGCATCYGEVHFFLHLSMYGMER